MRILWSSTAWADIDRLHAFLEERDPDAADAVFDRLANAPSKLLEFPRRGSRLSRFDPQDVRELRVGAYILRYELVEADVRVVRFFHAKEERG
jgi:plasmid stabilization system protein ParE